MLVLGAAQAALTLFTVQAASSVLLANTGGTPVDVRFAAKVFPYIGIQTDPTSYVRTLSWSIACAVAATTAGALWNLFRRRDNPLYVMGWASGILMSLVLISLQVYRQITSPPVINYWIVGQALAFTVGAALIFLAYRPTGRSIEVPTSASPSSDQSHREHHSSTEAMKETRS